MAKVKSTIKGKSSYTAVAVTVETCRRKNKVSNSYQPKHRGKKKSYR